LSGICKWIVRAFVIVYAIALGLLLVGTFGLFGQERDPLSGVFLIPLGLPWAMWLDGFSENLRPWAAALAPLLNIIIIVALCRALRRGNE
jgi:hypothetical protein